MDLDFDARLHAISASIQVPLIHFSLSTHKPYSVSVEAKQSADKYVSDNSIGESSKCHSMILMATAAVAATSVDGVCVRH